MSHYSGDLEDESESEDEIDNASVGNRSQRMPVYPELYQPSNNQYQYFNSPRDLTLPLQKHKNVQHVIYESPDEGESKIFLNFWFSRS